METATHRSPSAGSIIKKIVNINPDLTLHEIIQIIRQSSEVRPENAGEFRGTEVINEGKALALALATCCSE